MQAAGLVPQPAGRGGPGGSSGRGFRQRGRGCQDRKGVSTTDVDRRIGEERGGAGLHAGEG